MLRKYEPKAPPITTLSPNATEVLLTKSWDGARFLEEPV